MISVNPCVERVVAWRLVGPKDSGQVHDWSFGETNTASNGAPDSFTGLGVDGVSIVKRDTVPTGFLHGRLWDSAMIDLC